MKKLLIVCLLALVVAGATWAYLRFLHKTSPGDVYLTTASAAMLGDEETFLSGFTPASRPILSALMELNRSRDPRTSSTHPYYFLVTEQVEDVGEPQPGADGQREVWLTLKRAGDKATGTEYSVRMVALDEGWRIDALSFTGKKHVVDQVR